MIAYELLEERQLLLLLRILRISKRIEGYNYKVQFMNKFINI